MVAEYRWIYTAVGQAKRAAAEAGGPWPQIVQFAVGDGGGVYHEPEDLLGGLINETWRGDVNRRYVHPLQDNLVVIEAMIPAASGGWIIREAALIDEDEDIVAVGKYPATTKPAPGSGGEKDIWVRGGVRISNGGDLVVQIGTSLVMATQEYVDDHAAILATETQVGHMQFATSAETIAGLLSNKAVHPVGLKSAVQAAIDAVLAAAPGALDTLNELAAALADDPNFATTITALIIANALPIGTPLPWATETPPARFLERNGALLSMTSYLALYDVLGTMYGKDTGVTCTFTASTDVINKNAHGLVNGTVFELSNSGGALPVVLASRTKYYVVNATTNTYQAALEPGGAAINFTTNGTGTSKYHVQFKLMDDRGLYDSNWDHSAGMDPDAATRTDRGDGTTGDHVGTYQADAFKSHTHTETNGTYGGGTGSLPNSAGGAGQTVSTGATGGNATRPRNRSKMAIIRAY